MDAEDNNKRIADLSDSDFLAFLYAERDREESLSKYQGWNIWAVAGALVTVFCAGYSLLSRNKGSLDGLSVAYYVSGLIALFLCLRPLSFIKTRPRGVDYNRVKFLKDTVPQHYLCLALISSIAFLVLFPIMNEDHPWGIVPILWMIIALLFIVTTILIVKNRNGVVRSDLDGRLFVKIKWEKRFGSVLGSVLSLIVVHSFIRAKGPFIGSPDFEIAICIVTVIALFYIIAKIRKEIKASEHLDVLIDEFLYKGKSKESVYQELSFHRMGRSVFAACLNELSELRDSLESSENQKRGIEELKTSLKNGSFDINRFTEYADKIQVAVRFSKKWNNRLRDLDDRLNQIEEVDPDLGINSEFLSLRRMLIALYGQSNAFMKSIYEAQDLLINWVRVYHCKKYGGWCVQECTERLENPSLRYRFEMFFLKHFRKLSLIVRMREPCK